MHVDDVRHRENTELTAKQVRALESIAASLEKIAHPAHVLALAQDIRVSVPGPAGNEYTNNHAEERPMTWRMLRDAVNALPESEMDKPIHWWGDERGGTVKRLDVLPEDYVETDEGCEPASVYSNGEYPVAHTKGTPILTVD
jgi:hypothetical protein